MQFWDYNIIFCLLTVFYSEFLHTPENKHLRRAFIWVLIIEYTSFALLLKSVHRKCGICLLRSDKNSIISDCPHTQDTRVRLRCHVVQRWEHQRHNPSMHSRLYFPRETPQNFFRTAQSKMRKQWKFLYFHPILHIGAFSSALSLKNSDLLFQLPCVPKWKLLLQFPYYQQRDT